MMNRRSCLAAAAALGATASGLTRAQAQVPSAAFPSKPIRVVIPSPPGGPPDLILRAVQSRLAALLGQPLVIDNRGGAGGMIGTAHVAAQAADGYTWLFTTASHVNIPPFNENARYDPIKDFTHVTLAAQNFGQALAVSNELPARNLQELIALARKSPGKLTYGNAGDGTASHIPAEVMKSMAGLDILSIPYKGVSEAITDVIAGRIDLFFGGTNIILPQLQSGRLRVLALTGAKRWKGLPDVPTMDEQGLKGFDKVNWFGLWLPAGAAPEIVNRIHAAMATAVNDPEVKQQFDAQGLEGIAMPPAAFARFVADESQAAQEIARRIRK